MCREKIGKPNVSTAKEEEEEELCSICLENKDDATVNGLSSAMCYTCGQSCCGACKASVGNTRKCPTCRAPLFVSDKERFKRCYKLVHDRSPGRHTTRAQNDLGFLYKNGKGVPQDYANAMKYYTLAADQGVAMAQCNLGIMYNKGEGVPQDYTKARKYFTLAAEQGHADAQNSLGSMYYNGDGVPQDNAKAIKYCTLAAEQGDAHAQFNLGYMYDKGDGVPEDYAKATTWYQLAAAQSHANAIKNLGNMQEDNLIPTPAPGTRIKLILLTSPKTSIYNNLVGKVVIPEKPVKKGKVAILLDDSKYPKPLAFKLKFAQVIEE